MTNQIESLVGRIKELESELIHELYKKEKEFFYVVLRKTENFWISAMPKAIVEKSKRCAGILRI